MVLLVLLALCKIGAAFVVFYGGPLVVFWSFRIRTWAQRQKTTWTTKRPPLSIVWPCPSSKGPKDQKDHACNTGTDGKH